MMRLALLAGSLLLLSCSAQPHQTRTEKEIQAAIDMADKAMNVTQKIAEGASAADVQAMLKGVTAAAITLLDATRGHTTTPTRDPVRHLEVFAAADAVACARSSVIEFTDIERMSERLLSFWATHLNECLALTDSKLSAVSSADAVEEIGFAVNMIYPVALVAHARAGFKILPVVNAYRSANETLLEKLAPRCSSAQADRLSACGLVLVVRPRLDSWARTMTTLAQQTN
jgi:hypothetical protein